MSRIWSPISIKRSRTSRATFAKSYIPQSTLADVVPAGFFVLGFWVFVFWVWGFLGCLIFARIFRANVGPSSASFFALVFEVFGCPIFARIFRANVGPSPSPAANLLCPAHEKRTMREL